MDKEECEIEAQGARRKGQGYLMAGSFKIITLGCRVNQHESAYLNEELAHAGLRRALKGERADIAVINTCIVTQRASHQSRQAIRKAIRENPAGLVAAVGCYAQVFPDELTRIQGIGLIADNRAKGKLPGLLINAAESRQKAIILTEFETEMDFEFLRIKRFPGRTRANLKIQDGCQSFCTYCIVPFARGPYRSLPASKVLSMVESLAGEGYREIVLTGIHLGKYGVDLGGEMNLNALLRSLGKEGFPARIRLSSLHPDEIDEELIDMAASDKWLCRHFHISLQSGDEGTLKKMNRNYKTGEFAGLIETIYGRIPLAAMGVDIISGFPGEAKAAHENTCSLIKDLPVSYLHVFPFSARPGTEAAGLAGQIDPGEIKRRATELRNLGQTKRDAFYHGCLNKDFSVLAERWHSGEKNIFQGMSDNYLPVVFPSDKDVTGRLVSVNMEKVENGKVTGRVQRVE
jgi:threonylcarbamoyladenosine tRNA methylthiotransferase MtaB